jgi:prepilin-type N-terminal cleavage/methylation domain-containing protein
MTEFKNLKLKHLKLIENLKLKIENSRKGFTLIELLVVMAIIAVLTATALVNFGKNEDQDVRLERERLSTFVRDVQNRALTGEREGISPDGRLCGFGIHYDDTWSDQNRIQVYYILVTGDGWQDADCAITSNQFSDRAGQEDYYLKNKTAVSPFVGIFFTAPSGTAYLAGSNGGTMLGDDFLISISKGGNSAVVTITSAGNIY